MSDKPKTAVQWYIEEMNRINALKYEGGDTGKFAATIMKLRDQAEAKALAMEREQIEKAYSSGNVHGLLDVSLEDEYYTDTYGESPITNP